MACLETTFLIDLLQGKNEVSSIKDELDKTEKAIYIASPSVMELWAGAMLAKLPSREREKVTLLLSSLSILPLDEESAKEAGEIEAELLQKGITIETGDIMIAGIARKAGEKVVTRDLHYTRINGLKVLKY